MCSDNFTCLGPLPYIKFIKSRNFSLVLSRIMPHNSCVAICFVQFDCEFLRRKLFKIWRNFDLISGYLETRRPIEVWFYIFRIFFHSIFLVCQCLPVLWSARRPQFFFLSVCHFPGEIELWAWPGATSSTVQFVQGVARQLRATLQLPVFFCLSIPSRHVRFCFHLHVSSNKKKSPKRWIVLKTIGRGVPCAPSQVHLKAVWAKPTLDKVRQKCVQFCLNLNQKVVKCRKLSLAAWLGNCQLLCEAIPWSATYFWFSKFSSNHLALPFVE